MKRIMCYGASNTWGYNPADDLGQEGCCGRFPEHVRWTSVMEDLLGPGAAMAAYIRQLLEG